MIGPELKDLANEINGGDDIGDTLLFSFLNLARALVEQRRPWMLLRNTDTSKTVAAGTTWQTAIDLATIPRFSRFYGDFPIKLFDGNNRIERYRERPIQNRLYDKGVPNTFCFDPGTKTLYLNGTPTFAGTLWIDHLKDSPDIEDEEDSEWGFPSWSHPLLAFMAVGIHKGGVDFDDINARMSVDNRAQAEQIVRMLENWDNELQLASTQTVDYAQGSGSYRSGAIDMDA